MDQYLVHTLFSVSEFSMLDLAVASCSIAFCLISSISCIFLSLSLSLFISLPTLFFRSLQKPPLMDLACITFRGEEDGVVVKRDLFTKRLWVVEVNEAMLRRLESASVDRTLLVAMFTVLKLLSTQGLVSLVCCLLPRDSLFLLLRKQRERSSQQETSSARKIYKTKKKQDRNPNPTFLHAENVRFHKL